MNKTIFEQISGTYTILGLPPEEERHIGVWAHRRRQYLKQHHKILYYNLLTSGKLRSHLADVEKEAQSLFLRLVKESMLKMKVLPNSLKWKIKWSG